MHWILLATAKGTARTTLPSSYKSLLTSSKGVPVFGTIHTTLAQVAGDFRDIIGPLAVMGMIVGGLLHTLQFFEPEWQQRGMVLVKYSAAVVIVAIIGPLLISALGQL